MNNGIIKVRKRTDKNDAIKDAIFSFANGNNSVVIKGEGREISRAVEIAEIVRHRMFPSIEISDISLGSRPFYRKGKRNKRKSNKYKKNFVSQIQIEISKKL
jgi:DNA-binding protein Alba